MLKFYFASIIYEKREGSGSWAGCGSIPLTNGSGSRRPKNMLSGSGSGSQTLVYTINVATKSIQNVFKIALFFIFYQGKILNHQKNLCLTKALLHTIWTRQLKTVPYIQHSIWVTPYSGRLIGTGNLSLFSGDMFADQRGNSVRLQPDLF